MSQEEILSRCTGDCEECEVRKECEEWRNNDEST